MPRYWNKNKGKVSIDLIDCPVCGGFMLLQIKPDLSGKELKCCNPECESQTDKETPKS